MKKLTIIAIIIFLLGGIGYEVYYKALTVASDQVIQSVSKEMEKSGEMEEIKKQLETDPKLQESIKNNPKLKNLIKNHKELQQSITVGTDSTTNSTAVSTTGRSITGKASTNNQQSKPLHLVKRLPFYNKEDAAKVLISKVGFSNLKDMYSKYKAGTMTKAEIVQVIKSKLTPDEITALKLVAYREVNK